jgi:TonB family protein
VLSLRRFQVVLFWLLFTCPCSPQAGPSVNGNSGSVLVPKQVRLSEILISTPQPSDPAQVAEAQHKAEELRDAIRQGGAFAELAKANSQGPTAAQGGDLGYFTHGTLARSLEELVFHMKVGEVSDLVRTKQGFVILEVTERLASDAHPDLPLEVLNLPVTPELTSYLQELMKKVRQRWYELIPYSAHAPQMKRGRVTIEFTVRSDGAITEQKIASGSGDVYLDEAALRAIRQASPFSPLPNATKPDRLVLRIHFQYNPAKTTGSY